MATDEVGAPVQPQCPGIVTCGIEGGGADVDTDTLRPAQFGEHGQQQAPAPGAQVEHAKGAPAPARPGQRRLDQGFRIGTRNQGGLAYPERQAPELALPDDAGPRFAPQAPPEESPEVVVLIGTEDAFPLAECGSRRLAEDVLDEQPRIQARRDHARLRQAAAGIPEGFTDGARPAHVTSARRAA